MDQGFRFLCLTEVKRLLFLMGASFLLVISFQYFEFPSNTVLSLFPVLNTNNGFFPSEPSSWPPSPSPLPLSIEEQGNRNNILSNGVNSTSSSPLLETTNSSEVSIAKNVSNYGLVSSTITLDNSVMPNKSLVLEKGQNTAISSSSSLNVAEELVPVPQKKGSWRASAKRKSKKPNTRVFSIAEMNDLLRLSRVSSHFVRPQWPLEVDQQLMFARSQIENAAGVKHNTVVYPPVYRNVSMFERSYELMENMLRVYIYQEGEKPIFHQSILEGIYASEGWFMKLMEASKKFVTKDPKDAHLFYIPFSSRLLELTLYARKSHSRNNLIQYMKNYTNMIASKYSFWKRNGGSDHFVAACHDWAPAETRGRMLNCIRALCNADIDVGFSIGKDVSLPETYVHSAQNPLKNFDDNRPSEKPYLAFFAGNVHGFVRPILLEYWENKDPDMKIYGPLPHVKGNANYIQHIKNSKYCICPRGHEVNSPRIVESIFFECVPVIISDNYVPPFFEVLDWESFAVFVLEKDIPNLKNILVSIPEERYVEMHKRVKKVQQHFLWHSEPVKYDLFHMILHSVWYNRVFQMKSA